MVHKPFNIFNIFNISAVSSPFFFNIQNLELTFLTFLQFRAQKKIGNCKIFNPPPSPKKKLVRAEGMACSLGLSHSLSFSFLDPFSSTPFSPSHSSTLLFRGCSSLSLILSLYILFYLSCPMSFLIWHRPWPTPISY